MKIRIVSILRWLSGNSRGRYPDLGVRAAPTAPLAPPNPAPFHDKAWRTLEIEWQNWKEEYRLNSHFDEHQDIHQSLTDLQQKGQQKADLNTSFFVEETISNREIDKIWFNQIINNSAQQIEELRKVFYENYEKYRQTTHWKRTRAAILLISKAVCQAGECNTIGASWYGGNESELEVHHLDYSNIGNESFEDLALLCRYHHSLLHANLKSQGSIGIEII